MLQARNERWREDRTQNEKRAASSVPDVGLPPLGRANRRGMLDTAAATGERLPRGGCCLGRLAAVSTAGRTICGGRAGLAIAGSVVRMPLRSPIWAGG
jgi:hypothetical protein